MNNQNTEYFKNRLVNRLEIEQRKIILNSRIRRLMVVLTGKCNLHCIMCERKASDFTLPQERIRQIINFFPYLDLIMWQGGEVFIVNYFKEFFQQAAKFPQLFQEINTNGLLIDEEWSDVIAKTNTRLIFSIDSTQKDTYEYIRKGARFETLIRNITQLKETRQRYSKLDAIDIINVVVMRSNYRELEDFIDFALEYNFGGINFLHMIGDKCPQEDILHPPDYQAINFLRQQILKLIEKASGFNINITHEFAPYLNTNEVVNINQSETNEKLLCTMPWRSFFIDGSQGGNVYPECLCRIPVGNILEDSLEEIWNNEKMQLYRRKIAEDNLKAWCNPDCINGMVNKEFLQGL